MNPNIPPNPHRIKPPADIPPPKDSNVLAELVLGTGKLTVFNQGGNYLFQHKEMMGEREIRTLALVDSLTDLKGLSRALSALHDRREQELNKLRPKEPETIQVTYTSGVARPSDYVRGIERYLPVRDDTHIPKCGMEVCDDCDCEKAGWFQKTWKNLKRDLGVKS